VRHHRPARHAGPHHRHDPRFRRRLHGFGRLALDLERGRPLRQRAADDAEHGPPAPVDPRRAPGRPQARRRGDHRLRPGHRLPPPRHREAGRGPPLLPDRPLDRPHRLRRGADEQPRLRDGDREAGRRHRARARPVLARDHERAGPDCQPPGLAGHPRPRHRRPLDVALLLPRAGADPRHLRDLLRRPADDQHDGDRGLLAADPREPAGHGPRLLPDLPGAAGGVRGAPLGQPDLDGPDQGRRRDHPGGRYQLLADRRLPPRLGHQLRRPQGDAVPGLRPARLRGAARPAWRHLRPLPRPDGGDAADDQDHRAVPGPVRGDGHPADGLRVALRDPPPQGDDDDGRGHAAALHLDDQGVQPADRRSLRRGRRAEGRVGRLHRLRRRPPPLPVPAAPPGLRQPERPPPHGPRGDAGRHRRPDRHHRHRARLGRPL
ncbi:MAG: NADH-ubiquinone oxidoreductase chain D, partial [uncultured Thermomicrobiales bacterium]